MIHLLLLPDWWLASSARRSKPILASKASYNACTILAGSKLPIMQKCVKDSRESMQENLLPLAYSFCLLQQKQRFAWLWLESNQEALLLVVLY